MNSSNSQRGIGSENPWTEFFREAWNEQVESDGEEIDVELLAAYAEGSLDAQEQQEAEALLARSPAALDMLVAMREHVTADRQRGYEAQAGSLVKSSGRESASAIRKMQRFPAFTVAASLIVAVGAIGWTAWQFGSSSQLRSQLAAADEQLFEQAQLLTTIQKEQLAIVSRSPIYLAGPKSPRLIELAMMEDSARARGDGPDVRIIREQSLNSARTSIKRWHDITGKSVIPSVIAARASVEISAGDLQSAQSTISLLADEYGEAAPQVRNLRAVHLLALSETQPIVEADTTKAQALKALESLTEDHPQFADGWLNLALLLQRDLGKNHESTKRAWQNYIRFEANAELREAALRNLSDDLPATPSE